MDKYIIITTLCSDKNIADKIVEKLLNEKLVSGSQLSTVHSKYWWNEELEECEEYKLEFRSKYSLFNKIKEIICSIHDYEVAEISCVEIIDANSDFLSWIDNNII